MWGCVPKNFEKICYSDRLLERYIRLGHRCSGVQEVCHNTFLNVKTILRLLQNAGLPSVQNIMGNLLTPVYLVWSEDFLLSSAVGSALSLRPNICVDRISVLDGLDSHACQTIIKGD